MMTKISFQRLTKKNPNKRVYLERLKFYGLRINKQESRYHIIKKGDFIGKGIYNNMEISNRQEESRPITGRVGPGVEESGKRKRIEEVAQCPKFADCLDELLVVLIRKGN
jgi:hypothetical protein